MSRPQLILTGSLVLFLLERILPTLIYWPVFIFPVFVILFMLTSRNGAREIPYIVVISLVFDFFSGYHYGFMIIIILFIVSAIIFFKTYFSVDPQSFLSLAVYTLVFSFAYFALISIKSGFRIGELITRIPTITIEIAAVFIVFNLVNTRRRIK